MLSLGSGQGSARSQQFWERRKETGCFHVFWGPALPRSCRGSESSPSCCREGRAARALGLGGVAQLWQPFWPWPGALQLQA